MPNHIVILLKVTLTHLVCQLEATSLGLYIHNGRGSRRTNAEVVRGGEKELVRQCWTVVQLALCQGNALCPWQACLSPCYKPMTSETIISKLQNNLVLHISVQTGALITSHMYTVYQVSPFVRLSSSSLFVALNLPTSIISNEQTDLTLMTSGIQ